MTKREKVMEGLEYCFALGCDAKCPYIKEPCCTHVLLQDAFALLKEQEARVMTLDEVLTAEDFVWAEIYTPNKWSWCVIYAKISPVVGNDEIVKIEEDCGTAWTKNKSEYGKRGFLDGGWRCWSARPSEQQMRETPWGGEEETK